VGEGGFGARVATKASGEVGEAIDAFNRMSTHLAELEKDSLLLKERQHLGELGDVARGLAHALRNPLHAIGLSVEELASRAESPEAVEIAESARRQIRRVDESIRSFLALASGGGGAVEDVDVGGVVEDVALSALQDARSRVGVDVAKPESPCCVLGIPAEIRAVVQALVVNAVEASADGARVGVSVSPREGGVRVAVEDQGPGLPAEVRERLFLPHVTTKANGSGMGLFLAQRIASTRYAGRVALEDRTGGGTRALLELGDREGARDA
jgi:signal transduction histidine kinase